MPSLSTFNWQTGVWSNSNIQAPDVKLCFAGDWAPIRKFQPIIETDPDSVYGDLLPHIRTADLSVVNLEAPLSDTGEPVHKSGAVFKGEQKHINGLLAVPFDVVTLANNHVFDYGLEAFQNTVDVLEKRNIRHVGAGMSKTEALRPLMVERNGAKIAIVNFSEGEDLTAADEGPGVMGWELENLTHQIKELKKEGIFVIVISHCGIEYVPFPPPYVVNTFQLMADAGADLVIGHHPHVPQGISFYNNVPKCYSLGNFVFYQETRLKYRKLGYMVKIGIKQGELSSFELVPYQILDHGLSLLNEKQLSEFLNKIREISIPLDTAKGVDDTWAGFLDYYGINGFFNEIEMIIGKLKSEPEKGAAMFRNRLTTLQHFHHWKDLQTRIVQAKMGSSPDWTKERVREWFTEQLSDA